LSALPSYLVSQHGAYSWPVSAVVQAEDDAA